MRFRITTPIFQMRWPKDKEGRNTDKNKRRQNVEKKSAEEAWL